MGSTPVGKNLLLRRKSFSFKVNPIWCVGKETGSHHSCLPLKKMVENLLGVYILLIFVYILLLHMFTKCFGFFFNQLFVSLFVC